MRCSKDTDHQT